MKYLKEWIKIDPDTDTAVYIQITNAFIHNIRNGRLRKGLKLPGSRTVADQLNINRMTMVAVYNELNAQGWIDIIPRNGAFIKKELPELTPRHLTGKPEVLSIPRAPNYSLETRGLVPYPSSDFPDPGKLTINDGFPDPRLAPTEMLVRSMRRQSRQKPFRKYLMYGGPKGTALLRETLANVLSDTRGIPTTPDNLLITRGAQMGIFISASLLVKPGDDLIVGEPGYFGANLTFAHCGAKINRVPVDAYGMDIHAVEKLCQKKKVKLVYVIPHHHHPTTVTLIPERRVRLLELSARYKFAIIEDDYDYDFHYSSKPMMPMASLDSHGNIIYIGTLTKTLAPAFRIGFMTGSKKFIDAAANLRRFIDYQGDSLLENAIAELFSDGTIGRHIKKAVKMYRERRDHFCKLLFNELGDSVSFKIPDGGMSVWTNFRNTDLAKLSVHALRNGLVMSNGKEYNTHTEDYNSVRLGFASLNFHEQERAVKILKDCIEAIGKRVRL